MPSPVGHTLAGLAIGWVAQATRRPSDDVEPVAGWAARARQAVGGLPLLAAAVALLPDFDLLANSHRTLSHSVGATVAAGGLAGAAALGLRRRPWLTGVTCAAAYGSHILLDWLGRDSSAPSGLMVWWPISRHFYASGLDLFAEVSRRYWNPAEFVVGNLRSVAQELLLLGPLAVAAYMYHRWRTSGRRTGSEGA